MMAVSAAKAGKTKTKTKAKAKAKAKAKTKTRTAKAKAPQTKAKAKAKPKPMQKPTARKTAATKTGTKKRAPAKKKAAAKTPGAKRGIGAKSVVPPGSVPGITASEHRRRREVLMSMMSPDSIALIPGASLKRRNRDIQYLFRQDSDFYYLSGFAEPESLLVLAPGREHGEQILFCPDRDPVLERWDGERMGPERATQMLGRSTTPSRSPT